MNPKLNDKVELFFSARNLPKLDLASNTDPFAVLFRVPPHGPKELLKMTECIMDTQNPNWVTQFLMDYMFEENQMFEVAVYDKDTDDMRDLSKHQLCGTARFSLGSVMCARGQTCNLSLAGGLASNNERVIIRAETVASNRDTFSCSFAGSKLANKDGFFGKSDPFYVISRIREDGSYQAVYQSDKIMDNLSPTWQQMTISLQALCNCDIDRPLKVEIFDWDSDGKHDTMGSVTTSVRQLLESRGASMDVIEEDKKKKSKGYVNSGTLQCLNAGIKSHPAFLDFLKGGCEISLSVAIDFTGSNGNPSNPTSLHYIHRDGSSFNQYESAIMAVGSVLEPYDSDRKYPVYGFGAQISNGAGGFGPVEHCFPVYSGGYEIDGIAGILQAYHECIGRVHLSGPTLFSPLISYNLEMIKAKGGCSQAKQWYNVLLIISDGIINDMENTISNIVDGSDLPLSIIVIGVGNADFSGMRELDGDGGLLRSRGKTAKRDIVQFVKFNDYSGPASSAVLAKEVLAEIPDQILRYMELRGINPNPPPPPYSSDDSPSYGP